MANAAAGILRHRGIIQGTPDPAVWVGQTEGPTAPLGGGSVRVDLLVGPGVRTLEGGDTGRMAHSDVAADGSPVDVYVALPVAPEFDPVLDALPAAGSVLDLGCGAGRLSNVLAQRGYEAVGVDGSAQMVAHLDEWVTPVVARIEELDLGRTFDVVVLASYLVNTADLEQRASFLATVRRHLDGRGRAFVQRYDPTWTATVEEDEGQVGDVHVHLEVLGRSGCEFEARSTFRLGTREWVQRFRARVVDDAEMRSAFEEADLQLRAWLTERWAVATPRARTTTP